MTVQPTKIIGHFTLAITAIAGLSVHAASPIGAKAVMPPNSVIAGKTQGQWSMRWWQWAYSFDDDEGPIADETGDLCGMGQRGSVWFLAGSFEATPIKRRCTVPAGKYLFFPIINSIAASPSEGAINCQALIQNAKGLADSAKLLTLIVDGEVVQNVATLRQASPTCFNAGELAQENVLSAANGYFAMLEPLSPGKHVIKWGGAIDDFRQAVIYELIIKE